MHGRESPQNKHKSVHDAGGVCQYQNFRFSPWCVGGCHLATVMRNS